MAGGRLIWSLIEPVLSATGLVVAGASLYVYRNRTTDLADVFADESLSTPVANPQTEVYGSNSAGRFFAQTKAFWVNGGEMYTLRVTRPDGTFDQVDDIAAVQFGSSADSYETVAIAESADVAAGVGRLFVNAYASAGDGGGAWYIRTASEPDHSFKFQSNDGQWWVINEETIDIRMGGATPSSISLNTTLIPEAMALGPTYIPDGDWQVNAFNVPGNSRLFGNGKASCLKCMQGSGDNWINVLDVQNVVIEKLFIDGNRTSRTGGYTATAGGNIIVGNTEIAFEPRRNNVIIQDCYIANAGFVGIYGYNCHDVWVVDNYLVGDRDGGIAFCQGSSNIHVTGNTTAGWAFGVSMSTDGNADVLTTGYVRDWEVSNNIIRNTKLNGYGLQFDGVKGFVCSGNIIVMDGGLYGVRLNTSTGGGAAGVLDCFHGVITGTIIHFLQNVSSAGFQLVGTGDITSVLISGCSISSEVFGSAVYGLSVTGGVTFKASEFSIASVGNGVYIDTSNVVSSVSLSGFTVKGCNIGLQPDATGYANKSTLRLVDCDFSDGVTANVSVNSTFNLALVDTPLVGTNSILANTRNGDPVTGSATYDPGSLVDAAGATTTVTVTGAVIGGYATASFSNDLQGITLTGWVSSAGTVSVRFQNETGGTLDLASGTLRAMVKNP